MLIMTELLLKIKTPTIFIIILQTFTIYLCCQSIPFNHINTLDGLSNNNVNDIIQDKTGFIWFATDDGLNRFDGYNFKVFRHNSNNRNSISNNSVIALREDSQGKIWIGTKNGWLNCYDPVIDQFTSRKIESGVKIETSITFLYEDSKNKIWIGTYRNGLYRLDPNNEKLDHWNHDPNNQTSLSNNYISSILEDNLGNIWISTYNGLNVFNPQMNNKFIHYFKDSNAHNSISDNTIWSLSKSSADPQLIYISTAGGLNTYRLDTKSFSQINIPFDKNLQFSASAGSVIEEFNEREKILWIDSYAGVIRLNMVTGESMRIVAKQNDPNSLKSNQVNRMIKDRSGVIWIATNKGISVLSPKTLKFNMGSLTNLTFLDKNKLLGKSVTSIKQTSNGKLWFGTDLGLFSYKGINDDHFLEPWSQLNSLNIWSMTLDSSQNLWLGTYGFGLYEFNTKTKVLKSWLDIDKRSNANSTRFNKAVYCDNTNNIWIGFWGAGLARLNKISNDYRTWIHDPMDSTSLSHNDVWIIYQDRRSRLWIGTNGGGLNLFEDVDGGKFYHLFSDENNYSGLSSNTIYSICESRHVNDKSLETNTVLWIGTNNGLNRLEIEGQNNQKKNIPYEIKISRFTTKDGLADNLINSIIEDPFGNLWLGTSSGITLFEVQNKRFINFNIADGIVGTDFNHSSAIICNDGMLLIGSTEGLNYFYPRDVNLSTFNPPLLITEFQIFNQSITFDNNSPLRSSIEYTKEIILPHFQNVFSFQFVALDYTSPQSILYAYKMEGFINDWVSIGNRRFVTFTNLDPGEYIFKVKSTNSDGLWRNNLASIKVIILAPWWQTAWAIGVFILIFILGTWGIIWSQIYRARLRHELKMSEFESHHIREIEKMKSRFFANISHEFRTPLMLIKGPLEQIINGRIKNNLNHYHKMILRNAEKLQHLIDQLLELSQLEAEAIPLHKRQYDIIRLVKSITSNFLVLAQQRNINLQFSSPLRNVIALIDQDKLEKIINNLIVNAIKFTPSGGSINVQLTLEKQQKNDIIIISISDTGIGIPEEQRTKIFDRFYQIDDSSKRNHGGAGIGLALVKELVSLHNWNISVFSKVGEGTVFTIRIPLENKTDTDPEIDSSDLRSSYPRFSVDDKIEELTLNNNEINYFIDKNSEIPTILFVEDSSDTRLYISDLLSKDYKVILAENAQKGLEIAITTLPDLVLSDIMMPGMDGIEFCHRLKTDLQTSHIPVILLTAKALENDKIEGLETGADDYLTKPFNFEELTLRIKNLIDQRKILREKFSKEINIQPDSLVTNSIDKEFINKILLVLEKNLSNEKLDMELLAKEIFLSQRQLHRKIKAITGHTPGEFIRIFKLKRAAKLVLENHLSITQIALEVGFESPAQFSRSFKKYFGFLPSELKEQSINNQKMMNIF